MKRREFSCEFKIEALPLVTDRGVSVAQAARDLDIGESLLRRWMRELSAAPTMAFRRPPDERRHGRDHGAEEEVARLKAERPNQKWLADFTCI